MTAQPDTVYQFNIKIGEGYDADLHNIYASNGAEAVEQLDFFEETLLPRLIALRQTARAGSVVATAGIAAPATQQAQPTEYAQSPSPGYVSGPAGPPTADAGHVCAHGQPMKLIPAGISKASGKPYKAFYVCAQPRGMQCDTRVSV